jgi:hypothetical protein
MGNFVHWRPSTETGDFIRDAARAIEVDIEGHVDAIKVSVPPFNDRTFYLRKRLRKVSREILEMAALKQEWCDRIAHRGSQRPAMTGCVILVAYWYTVY